MYYYRLTEAAIGPTHLSHGGLSISRNWTPSPVRISLRGVESLFEERVQDVPVVNPVSPSKDSKVSKKASQPSEPCQVTDELPIDN